MINVKVDTNNDAIDIEMAGTFRDICIESFAILDEIASGLKEQGGLKTLVLYYELMSGWCDTMLGGNVNDEVQLDDKVYIDRNILDFMRELSEKDDENE